MAINKIKTCVEVSSTKSKLSRRMELFVGRGHSAYTLFIPAGGSLEEILPTLIKDHIFYA